MPTARTSIVLAGAVAFVVAGCGEPKRVTYVDPNGPDTAVVSGDGGEPFVKHGAAAIERSRSCIAIRSALAVARTMAVDDPASPSDLIDAAVQDSLPMIEARGTVTAPKPTAQLRTALERLRDNPPPDIEAFNDVVRHISDQWLKATCEATVPITARQDASFRAAMLSETLQAAAIAYEEAFDAHAPPSSTPESYRRAYGLLIDASTRQLEALPDDARLRVRKDLDAITRRAAPGPTPPRSPRAPELVVGELNALSDDVVFAAKIDPAFPSPQPEAPDQLRSLKRAIATAVEAVERDAPADGLAMLRRADEQSLKPAAASIAAVSPAMLADLERGLLVSLPTAVREQRDVAAAASDVDALLDEAIRLVEEELELLREN